MPGAVHVELLVVARLDHFVDAALAQAEIDQALRQHAQRSVVRRDPLRARLDRRDRRGLRGKHHLVDIALHRLEPSAHRISARDIRSIAVEFAAGVDQQQIAGLEQRVVLHVMQHAGIGTAGDNRCVGRRLRAAAAEFVQQLGFDLVFGAAGLGRAHRAPVRVGRNLRRAPHRRHLVCVLDEPHLIEQRAHVMDRGRRRDAAARLRAHRVDPAQHAAVPWLVAAEVAKELRLIGKQLRHPRVEFADDMAFVEAEFRARLLGTQAKTIPHFALRIALAAKQYACGSVAGYLHQHRLGLGKSGQIVKVAVVAVRIMRVAIARLFPRGGNYRDAALHQLREPRAPLYVHGGNTDRELRSGHAGIINLRPTRNPLNARQARA